MPRRTSIALAFLATACSGPRAIPVQPPEPTTAHEPGASAPVGSSGAPVAEEASVEAAPAAPSAEPAAAPPVSIEAQQPVEHAPDTPPIAVSDAERDLQRQLHRLIDARDYVSARALLDDATTVPLIADARVLIARGQTAEALAVAEKAVSQAPGEPRALMVQGEAALQLGIERRDTALLERALAAFTQAGPTAGALFGASRASRALGRTNDALRQARDGWRAYESSKAPLDELAPAPESPERTLAEATWNAWTEVRTAADERAAELFSDTERALDRVVAREPSSAWGWSRLAELYRDARRFADEQRTFERAIAALPADASLYEGLATSLAASGDPAAALTSFERLQRTQPQSPLPWWFGGRQRFQMAVKALATTSIDALRQAEREFATCRQRGGTSLGLQLESEALCRTAIGWCLLQDGDLEGALAAFRSPEQLFTGAKRVSSPPEVAAAVDGIAAIAHTYALRDDFGTSAKLYLELHHYEPRELKWARLSAETHRDSGEQTKFIGDDCARAADRKINDARRIQELRQRVHIDPEITSDSKLRSEFKRKSGHWLNTARQQFETSWSCYLDAIALAPDDLRLLNDGALIAVYYLRAEIGRAEELLRSAVTLGERRTADPTLSPQERHELLAAWGDAHQNLGKLYLEYHKDPATARTWFLRSVEIGPTPRPEVTGSYLPKCEKLLRKE